MTGAACQEVCVGVIVGAAILRDGRVLAARRSAPPSMAGGWEFPGGKVEPGETETEALIRECEEELGVTVRLGARVGDDVMLPSGWVLRVWLAEIDHAGSGTAAQPRPLQDHDTLRWLAPHEVSSVDWLPADWPVVHALADVLGEAEDLPGGRVGGAVRVGDTVRRPTGPWTPAVHELLDHLAQEGVPAVPCVLGRDGAGREVLRYIPGRTMGAAPVVPADFRSQTLLGEVGGWLARFHDATRTFSVDDRQWRRGTLARRPTGVICHNDVSPHNVALDERGALVGVLDWDMAAPGDPLDDVAFAAWQFVLRHGASLEDEAAGLRALASAYGTDPARVLDRVGPRLRGAVRFMRRGAQAGDEGLRRLLTTGIPEQTQAGADQLARRRDALRAHLH